MKTHPYLIGADVASKKADIDIHDPQDHELGHFVMTVNNHHINQIITEISQVVDKKNTIVIMEATGTYHRIFYFAFLNNGFQVVIVNPYQSNQFQRAASLRKTTTDKISAHALAMIYRYHNFPLRVNPETHIELKKMTRAYYTLIDNQSCYKKRIKTILAEIFPLFSDLFGNPFSKTATALLKTYPTPQHILNENPKNLFTFIKSHSRKNASWTVHKLDLLIKTAQISPSVEKGLDANLINLNTFLITIENLQAQIQLHKNAICKYVDQYPQAKLLKSIPGIGPILAATIIGEIGCFNIFQKTTQLVAFAGIDPSVKESGNFKGSKNRMSKRGSKFLRRALYLAALAAIRKNRTGKINNPYLNEYYNTKLLQGKPKKVTLGACMNKMASYIFATLRDNRPFKLINPKIHQSRKKAA